MMKHYETRYNKMFSQLNNTDTRLIYLDSAATTLTPDEVARQQYDYYTGQRTSIHRSMNSLSDTITESYETVRAEIARYIHAQDSASIVFTSGATHSLNMAAQGIMHLIEEGDEIVVSIMEHHANILPWQRLAQHTGARLVIAPLASDGSVDLDSAVTPHTKIVALTHMSNVTGMVNDLDKLDALPERVITVVDAAQSIAHIPIDVTTHNISLLAFSGHKMYGPTGIGVLYIQKELLSSFTPLFLGGGMVGTVTHHEFTMTEPPSRFEAGTPNIAGVLGMGAALRFLTRERVSLAEITNYARERLEKVVTILSPQTTPTTMISFTMEGIHPHDIASLLDDYGIIVRAGHHCAQPYLEHLGVETSVRASFGIYTTREDIDELVHALRSIRGFFNEEGEGV